ncbi:hypothetical protein [Brevundimonas vesicularis]|uniref:hypothetical protein n=1 Tax=Brevundimonas vesicularis TaxID=41276 RepID=UPI0028A8611A|nr:hypothetical protein [Brevundimonas vesicularis]
METIYSAVAFVHHGESDLSRSHPEQRERLRHALESAAKLRRRRIALCRNAALIIVVATAMFLALS